MLTLEEKQVWMQNYIEDKNQILNLYNTVTKEISDEINVLLTPEEVQLITSSRKVDREAYDAYLKGFNYAGDLSPASLIRARQYLNNAIEKDPDWAPLYAAMATISVINRICVGLNHPRRGSSHCL